MELIEADTWMDPWYRRIMGRRTGLVRAIKQSLTGRNESDVCITTVEVAEFERNMPGVEDEEFSRDLGVTGKGWTTEEALNTSVGEFVERYALCWPDTDNCSMASYTEKRQEGPVIDFEYLDIYGSIERIDEEDQSMFEVTKEDKLDWTIGHNLLTGEETFVPSDLVWLGKNNRQLFSTSNGAAAGPSLESALVSSIYETVERDAFMRMWCRQDPPSRLRFEDAPAVQRRIEAVEARAFDIHLFDYDSRVDLPTVGVAAVNRDDAYPNFIIAGAAAQNYRTAAINAIKEVGQGLVLSDQLLTDYNYHEVDSEAAVTNLVENVIYYAHPSNFGTVEFLFDGEETVISDTKTHGDDIDDSTNELNECLRVLDRSDYTPICVDVTTCDALELGIRVTKVIVPELVGLSSPAALPTEHPAFEGEQITDKPHPFP
jgi:ribosomal protein S12 methylthiotransferase accessory factor